MMLFSSSDRMFAPDAIGVAFIAGLARSPWQASQPPSDGVGHDRHGCEAEFRKLVGHLSLLDLYRWALLVAAIVAAALALAVGVLLAFVACCCSGLCARRRAPRISIRAEPSPGSPIRNDSSLLAVLAAGGVRR